METLYKGTTKSNGKKNINDKFYTNSNVVEQCLSFIDTSSYQTIIEPSAGSGAFSSAIEGCLAFDIAPEHESIVEADWLKMDKSNLSVGKTLIIGNPPFGTNGNLAMEFLVSSMTIADTVAFVLPRSFNKESVKSRVPLGWRLEVAEVLPVDSFTLEGKKYGVPCVFQIWVKDESAKEKKVSLPVESNNIKFTTKEQASIRIQRVGGNAGKASLDLDRSVSSNYFIINTSPLTNEELVDKINSLNFPSIDETVGPRSLPKGELVAEIDNAIERNTVA